MDEIGFVWNPSFKFEEQDFLNRVERYANTHKDKRVPLNYMDIDGYPLGKKLDMVANGYLVSIGKLSSTEPHLKVNKKTYIKLEVLGQILDKELFKQQTRRTKESRGFNYYEFLNYVKEYYKQQIENNVQNPYHIPSTYVTKDGYKLGMFAQNVRASYAKYTKQLKPSHVYNLKKEQWQKIYPRVLHSIQYSQEDV